MNSFLKERLAKRMAFVLMPALMVFLACCGGRQHYSTQLNMADSMLRNGKFEVAKTMLDKLDSCRHDMKESQLMNLHLLQTQWKNKNFIDLSNDTTMDKVVEYYDRHGSVKQKMEAYYLLGCVFRDKESPLTALDCFQKATEKADTNNLDDADCRLLTTIHGQMSAIYALQRLPDRTLDELQHMYKYAALHGDTLNMLRAYRNRLFAYFSLNMQDSVLKISYEANRLLMKHGYKEEANSLWFPAIFILLDRKEYSKAGTLIKLFEENSGLVGQNGNVAQGYEKLYAYKGTYYLGYNRLDSAEHYFRKLLPFVDDKDNYNNAQLYYRGLFNVYERKGNTDSIAKYAKAWCEVNDSSVVRLSTEKIQRIRSIYDYRKYEELAHKKAEEANIMKFRVGVIVILAMVAVCLLAYSMYRWKAAQKLNEQKQYELYAQTIANYDKLREKMNKQQLHSDKQMEELRDEAERLKSIIENIKGNVTKKDQWSNESIVIYSEAARNLHAYAQKGIAPESLWKEIIKLTKLYMPHFIERLDDYNLNVSERKIILLIRLKFNQSETRNLMNISSQRLSNMRNKLNNKLFSCEGAKSLNNNVMSL